MLGHIYVTPIMSDKYLGVENNLEKGTINHFGDCGSTPCIPFTSHIYVNIKCAYPFNRRNKIFESHVKVFNQSVIPHSRLMVSRGFSCHKGFN
jgi:hypothetical protein